MFQTGKSNRKELLETIEARSLEELESIPIYPKLDDNVTLLKRLFDNCSDFVIREFKLKNSKYALAVFVDGLIKTEEVNKVLKTLMVQQPGDEEIAILEDEIVPVSQITKVDNYASFLRAVLSGDTGLIVEGNEKALLLGVRGAQTRSVSEPESESVIRGPREGFIENIRTNTSMLRRKLKTPRLKMKSIVVGTESNTNLAIAYLEGIASPEVVDEVVSRIEKIKIDAILESGYVEELIQDNSHSPFPQIQYTERPDSVAAALLEGRVAIFVDGTPMVLIVPTTLWSLMQASEDYYERYQISTLIRWLRYLFLIIALLTPSLYVAVTTFHQEMLPTTLLLSIAAAREAIPFPAVVEALIMEISFEALREAGIRLPRTVGQAVSILGALVVGQAAVQAGIVSAPMVIVVSITGIASFTVPHFNASIAFRMLRFPLMILASIFGVYGILVGIILIMGHMANLRSFGIPYLSPTAPVSAGDLKDVLIRAPWYMLDERPSYQELDNQRRMDPDLRRELMAKGGQDGATNRNADDKGESS